MMLSSKGTKKRTGSFFGDASVEDVKTALLKLRIEKALRKNKGVKHDR